MVNSNIDMKYKGQPNKFECLTQEGFLDKPMSFLFKVGDTNLFYVDPDNLCAVYVSS